MLAQETTRTSDASDLRYRTQPSLHKTPPLGAYCSAALIPMSAFLAAFNDELADIEDKTQIKKSNKLKLGGNYIRSHLMRPGT